MATAEHPITRSELRAELDGFRAELREHYATKTDLADLRTELNTKIDGMFWKIAGVIVASASVIVGGLRLWQL